MNKKITPIRKCIGCMERKPQQELIRIVKTRSANSEISFEVLPPYHKKDGRSAYICKNCECFKIAKKNHKLEKSFSSRIPPEVYNALEKAVLKNE